MGYVARGGAFEHPTHLSYKYTCSTKTMSVVYTYMYHGVGAYLSHTQFLSYAHHFPKPYPCALNEFVNDGCPLHHSELTQDVGHNPRGNAIEQANALLNAWSLVRGFGSMCIYTELTELKENSTINQVCPDHIIV